MFIMVIATVMLSCRFPYQTLHLHFFGEYNIFSEIRGKGLEESFQEGACDKSGFEKFTD